MKILYVEDEEIAMDYFQFIAKTIPEIEIVAQYTNPLDALSCGKLKEVELAILDIQMPRMDGIELAKRLRAQNPNLLIIYTTANEEYAMEAFRLKVAAYLLKPYNRDELLYAIETAKLLAGRFKKRIFARTFGYFDLFVEDKPVLFQSAKAKELLALLVDRRGGTVTTDQIISILWEDRPNDESTQSLCSKIVKTLQKELAENGIGDLLVTKRGVRSIRTDLFECDMYQLLDGNEEAKKQFSGDYMMEYSWGEERIAALWRSCQK